MGVTGSDIVSWLLQWQPLILRFFLRDGFIRPFCYSRAGESLYAQSYRHDNLEMMHYILRQITPEHLLDPIWFNEVQIGPSYIQAATESLDKFQIVLDEWLPKWPLEVSSLLTEADLFSLATFATPEIANSLSDRGIHIDKAKGPDGQSVWHAVVEYHERPEKMLHWLRDDSGLSCDTTSSNGNTPLMLAIQLGRLEAAMWLSKWSNLGIPHPSNKLTAPELAAKCQTNESVDIFRVIMDNIPRNERRGQELTLKAIRAVHNGRKARLMKLTMMTIRHNIGREQQRSLHYQKCLRVAENLALEKMQIILVAFKKPTSLVPSGTLDESSRLLEGLQDLAS